MFKLHCKRHYRKLATYITGIQHDVNTSRKRRRRDADIRSAAAAAARRSVTIGGGGVSKMSTAAARRRRRTALVRRGFVLISVTSLHLSHLRYIADANRFAPKLRPRQTSRNYSRTTCMCNPNHKMDVMANRQLSVVYCLSKIECWPMTRKRLMTLHLPEISYF